MTPRSDLGFTVICADPSAPPEYQVPAHKGTTPHVGLMRGVDLGLIPDGRITDATAAAWWRQLAAAAEQAAAWHDERTGGAL